MSPITVTKVLSICAALALSLQASPVASAQAPSDASGASAQDPTALMKDFLHYVRIAKPDLASASAKALLNSGISDADLASIVIDNDLEEKLISVLRRGRQMPGVSDQVAEIEVRVEDGRMALARNPELIAKSITMLTGSLREKMLAEERLVAAGEYAVPGLLDVVVKAQNPQLEVAATKVIERIKRQAVLPLCAALPEVGPIPQRKICNMLGEIGYPAAEPFLLELADSKKVDDSVKEAAMRAFKRLGGKSTSISAQFIALGQRFFDNQLSLIAWPTEPTNNIWHYDGYAGLLPTTVPTAIYGDVMSMTMALKALDFDPKSAPALSLYVAADLRRENDLRPGMTDPIFGGSRYSPQFFATAVGSATTQDVLALAIDRYDTALVRDAVEALSETTGRANIFGTARLPLLECLRYPDRRVQYDSALVLASALPDRKFPGDEIVVPLLGSAVRDSDAMYGMVVASNEEDRRTYGDDLKSMGFTVLQGGADYAHVRDTVGATVGLDLIVVRGDIDVVRKTVQGLRSDNLTAAVPVIACVNGTDQMQLESEYMNDRATKIWQAGAGQSQFVAAVTNLLDLNGSQVLDEGTALEYMMAALDALKSVALSSTSTYDITAAEPALLEALANRDGHERLMVAEVVALLPGEKAQQALFDAAITSDGLDQIDLFDLAAASARLFGNQATTRQISTMREMIPNTSGEIADAIGRAYGALNVGPEDAVQLLLKK